MIDRETAGEKATKPKIVGIIQARMGSSRLPGKMMMDLCGYPVLQWVIERCKRASMLDEIVVATTKNQEDDILIEVAKNLSVKTYQGSEKDVLGRFLEAAKLCDANIIVRICADNPLVAPEEIDHLITFYLEANTDYAFNHIQALGNEYPDGLGAEILSVDLLNKIDRIVIDNKHREHVTSYLWEHLEEFNIRTIRCPEPYNNPRMKLDIDTAEDYDRMRDFCANLSFESSSIEIFNKWGFH